jgi:outer membrane lipoprotein-sorting protein
MNVRPFSLALFLFLSSLITAEIDNAGARLILRKMDDLYRSSSSRALVEMEIVTPHWQRTLKMEMWSKGMEKTFVRILEPRKERGVATLKLDNEIWNYLPRTAKVIKVPPSMMMGSWMGSDFTNDDLVREYTFYDDYRFSLVPPAEGDTAHIRVACVPKEGVPLLWARVVLTVRKSDYLPVTEEFFDDKGRRMRIMRFSDIRTFGRRTLPAVMELMPENKKGQKTVVRYLDVAFDANIGDEVFSLRHLQSPLKEK